MINIYYVSRPVISFQTYIKPREETHQEHVATRKWDSSYTFTAFNSLFHGHYDALPLTIKIRCLYYGFQQYYWLKNVPLYHKNRKYFSDTEQGEWHIIQVYIQIFVTKHPYKVI